MGSTAKKILKEQKEASSRTASRSSSARGEPGWGRGWVKWFSDEKGYGFIEHAAGGEDLFVHYTGIVTEGFASLEEGDEVVFEVLEGNYGMMAENVRVVG